MPRLRSLPPSSLPFSLTRRHASSSTTTTKKTPSSSSPPRLRNMRRPHQRIPTPTEISLARRLALNQYRTRPSSPSPPPPPSLVSRIANSIGIGSKPNIGSVLDHYNASRASPLPSTTRSPSSDPWSPLGLSGVPPKPPKPTLIHPTPTPPPPEPEPEPHVLAHRQAVAERRLLRQERLAEERVMKGDGMRLENAEEEGRRRVEERRRWTFRGRMDKWWDESSKLGKSGSRRKVGAEKFQRPENEVWASTDPLKTSTRKLRPLLNLISTLPVPTALLHLSNSLLRPAPQISRLLLLAQSRALELGLDPSLLIVSRAWTTKGRKMKRYDARARGRAGIKHHPSARACVVVKEGESREMKERKELVRTVRWRMRSGAGVKGTEEGGWWNAPVGRWV